MGIISSTSLWTDLIPILLEGGKGDTTCKIKCLTKRNAAKRNDILPIIQRIFFQEKIKRLEALVFTTTPISNCNSEIRTDEETCDEATLRKKKSGVGKVTIRDTNAQALRL